MGINLVHYHNQAHKKNLELHYLQEDDKTEDIILIHY